MDVHLWYEGFTIISFLYMLMVGAVCIKILLDTKSSSKALAYIVLVIVFPLFGMIFYFSVGVNHRKKKLYQRKLNLDSTAFPELEHRAKAFNDVALAEQSSRLSYFLPLARYCAGESLSGSNNQVELLTNGEEKFPAVLQSIRAARHHIHIEYYIYENDDIGTQIGNLLMEKAKQGVEVRFIYDDFGSKSIRKKFILRLREAGVEAVPFYKINFIYFANRLNYRNHRKILVVDGTIGYVGGINVSDKYYNNGKNDLFWRDTHLKITGVSVLNLQHTFLTDWNFCSNQEIPFLSSYFPTPGMENSYGNRFVQVMASGPDSAQPGIMYSLIKAILLSKKEILITTPYFIPEKSFLDAMKIAKLSGVSIKIIVPYSSDSILVNTACNSYYEELLDVGIEVYQYKKGFVHAKTMVCDEFVSIIGTANLDNRSFDLNFEVNALVYDKMLAGKLKLQFESDLRDSKKILIHEWKSRPLYVRVIENIAQLFSPLL